MTVEISSGLSRGESRRLRRSPDNVYQSEDGRTEYRSAVVKSGEFPYAERLRVQRFDYVNGQWRVGSKGATFSISERSQRSIAAMAIADGCTRRRI